MRVAPACVLTVSAFTLNGCLFDPFSKELKQVRLQVGSLNQRVDRLESLHFGGSSTAASFDGAGRSSAIPLSQSQSLEFADGTPAMRGIRLPGLAMDVRKALTKLTRGLVNVITGWVEIPKRVHETSQASGAAAGWTFGLLRGFGYGFIRTTAGAYEVVTFPFPAPPGYRPVIQPEYVFVCDSPDASQ